nr:hypothetical protein [uncultured Albidiferax sp.]
MALISNSLTRSLRRHHHRTEMGIPRDGCASFRTGPQRDARQSAALPSPTLESPYQHIYRKRRTDKRIDALISLQSGGWTLPLPKQAIDAEADVQRGRAKAI